MEKLNNETWNTILNFLCAEFFGEQVYLRFQEHHFKGNEIAENEEPCYGVELLPNEKRLYDLIDTISIYLRENIYLLPRGEGDEKRALAKAFQDIFWSMVRLNHPILFMMQGGGLGIRIGYQIVSIPPQPPPFVEIPLPGRR